VSCEAFRSYRLVAAGCLVGRRVSCLRSWLPGVSWFAPGLAASRPLGRCGSHSRVSGSGGRVRVCRAPARLRGAR